MKYLFISACISFVLLLCCDRVEYFPDRPLNNQQTVILAHKGGGNFDSGNTLQGCIFGFNNLGGIECDIQRSSQNTLWLSHSYLIPDCGSLKGDCFASCSDNQINLTDSCLGPGKDFTCLEEVFRYMSLYHPNKFISLDVKAWSPCSIEGLNITWQMNEMAKQIINLTQKYHLENQVMVESETGDFLYYIKTHSSHIETYLSTNGDFELGMSRALRAGFTGISFKYKFLEYITKEHIDLLHQKGLKVQLWTVNGAADLKEALALKPDFIQTDDVMESKIMVLKNTKLLHCRNN